MPAPTKNTIVRASALVMAAGVNVLFVVLLASSRPRVTPEPIAAAMMWIVLERSRAPQQREARERARRTPAGRVERAQTMVPPVPDTSIQPVPALQPAIEDVASQPAVDWAMESQLAAERSAANYGKPFSPLPITDLAARLCKPRVPGDAMQAKMDEVLPPPPPEPALPPKWPPAGSVVLAGNVIVQFVQFGTSVGKKAARGVQPRMSDKRPESSVPDPNICD